jgi:hypothetical protein
MPLNLPDLLLVGAIRAKPHVVENLAFEIIGVSERSVDKFCRKLNPLKSLKGVWIVLMAHPRLGGLPGPAG